MAYRLVDEALVSMGAGEFEQEARRRLERLDAAQDSETAQTIYQRDVFPCEAERLRREALGRDKLDLLFVTVGAQASSPALAVLASPAEFVVLLHTPEARGSAQQVVDDLGLSGNQVAHREIGDGKNASMLYRVCREEWDRRKWPKRVGFDITGGLKTMSAAAAVAGFMIPGARIFYIDADQPKICERTFWVNERRIEVDNPFEVFGEIRRATARDLLKQGRYVVAAEAYETLAEHIDHAPDRFRAKLAKGYSLIESMTFEEAAKTLENLADELDRRANDSFALRNDSVLVGRAHVRTNAEGARRLAAFVELSGKAAEPLSERDVLISDQCRDFIAMLLAAAKRRMNEGQMDVAALLAYRASEAIVQRRLVLRSQIDLSNVDWNALASSAERTPEELLRDYYTLVSPKGAQPVEPPRTLGRAGAYACLAVAFPGTDVAERKDYTKFNGLGEQRNRSLLAHGVRQLKKSAVETLIEDSRKLFERMLDRENLGQAEREQLIARHTFLAVTGDHASDEEDAP